jgi:outer membrane immunogenic protein
MPVKALPPIVAPFSWTGFYIGVNGGGASGHTDWQYLAVPGLAPIAGATAHHNTSGGLVGGTVGWNWQVAPSFVLGVEGDWDWANISGSTTCPGATFRCESRINDIGTARARAGWAVDRVLFYVTGGGAWGDVRIRTVDLAGVAPPSGTPINGTNINRFGWTAGAGIEWAVWNNWSFKAEWLHYDLGRDNFNVDFPALQTVRANEHGEIFRVGANYRFDWGAPVTARY